MPIRTEPPPCGAKTVSTRSGRGAKREFGLERALSVRSLDDAQQGVRRTGNRRVEEITARRAKQCSRARRGHGVGLDQPRGRGRGEVIKRHIMHAAVVVLNDETMIVGAEAPLRIVGHRVLKDGCAGGDQFDGDVDRWRQVLCGDAVNAVR